MPPLKVRFYLRPPSTGRLARLTFFDSIQASTQVGPFNAFKFPSNFQPKSDYPTGLFYATHSANHDFFSSHQTSLLDALIPLSIPCFPSLRIDFALLELGFLHPQIFFGPPALSEALERAYSVCFPQFYRPRFLAYVAFVTPTNLPSP